MWVRSTVGTEKVTSDAAYCAGHTGFAPGKFVMMAVSGNDFGMDKEMLDNIFEPFFTTKDVDKETGLGWQRSAASSSRTRASSMSTANRAGEGKLLLQFFVPEPI